MRFAPAIGSNEQRSGGKRNWEAKSAGDMPSLRQFCTSSNPNFRSYRKRIGRCLVAGRALAIKCP